MHSQEVASLHAEVGKLRQLLWERKDKHPGSPNSVEYWPSHQAPDCDSNKAAIKQICMTDDGMSPSSRYASQLRQPSPLFSNSQSMFLLERELTVPDECAVFQASGGTLVTSEHAALPCARVQVGENLRPRPAAIQGRSPKSPARLLNGESLVPSPKSPASRPRSHSNMEDEANQQKLNNGLFHLSSCSGPEFLRKWCFSTWKIFVTMKNTPLTFNLLSTYDLDDTFEPPYLGSPQAIPSSKDTRQSSKNSAFSLTFERQFSPSFSENPLSDDEDAKGQSFLIKYVLIQPGSHTRTGWDIMSAFLLTVDVILIPLSVFGPSREGFIENAEWFTLVFWTLDMFMSCLTGVFVKGATVMEPVVILKTYLRTWFLLDIVVVGPDWLFRMLAFASSSSGQGASGTKLLKALRVLRSIRVLRLAKLKRILGMIRDQIDSQVTFELMKIFKMICALVVLNHYLASAWYGIGSLGMAADAPNWLESGDFGEASLEYRYTSSLHWSVCMFTPGSMDVQPKSSIERAFAITVLLFGLVTFSTFNGQMTAAIQQLSKISGNNVTDLWSLRRYLRQRGIKKPLFLRVTEYVEYAQDKQKDVLVESQIAALKLLSKQLCWEVRYQASFQDLNIHPFFKSLDELRSVTMHSLVAHTISQQSLAPRDQLFSTSTLSKHMHLIQAGEFRYTRPDECQQMATKEDWLCEAVLWTSWIHCGSARATTGSAIISIEGSSFAQTVCQETVTRQFASEYAANYVAWLSCIPRGDLTDLSIHKSMHETVSEFLFSHEDFVAGQKVDGATNKAHAEVGARAVDATGDWYSARSTNDTVIAV